MTFDPQNVQEFNHRFMEIVKAVVEQTPPNWNGGVLVIDKTPQGVRCELSEAESGRALAVNDSVLQLSQRFADFKRTDNWNNDWSSVTIRYSFDDPSVDCTATMEFVYPEADEPQETEAFFLDAAFWQQEIANNAWQRSPSLLVMAFILDCDEWQASTTAQSSDWKNGLDHIIRKFCDGIDAADITAHRHRISSETVCSAETINDRAVVTTAIHQDPGSAAFFEYGLIQHSNRWFLTKIMPKSSCL